MVALDPSTKTAKTIFKGSSEDRYHDPGLPVLVANASGHPVLRLTADGSGIYFIGPGASPEGDQPFVGVLPVSGGAEKKIWQSKAPFFEEPVNVLADDKILIRRESETVPPNYFTVARVGRGGAGDEVSFAVWEYPLPTRTVLHYKRADGLDLSANLWVPAGYDKSKGPLPTLMEAYPAEFKTRGAAGQVTGSPYRFPRIGWGSPVFFHGDRVCGAGECEHSDHRRREGGAERYLCGAIGRRGEGGSGLWCITGCGRSETSCGDGAQLWCVYDGESVGAYRYLSRGDCAVGCLQPVADSLWFSE